MGKLIIKCGLLLLAFSSSAQPLATDSAAVRATVARFFNDLAAKDTSAFNAYCRHELQLTTVLGGQEGLRRMKLSQMITALGELADEHLEERLQTMEIRIDGAMAMVWAPYRFYLNAQFSHCGVNLITLAKTSRAWQIIVITDIRRKQPCL